jgi:hypothetical protein
LAVALGGILAVAMAWHMLMDGRPEHAYPVARLASTIEAVEHRPTIAAIGSDHAIAFPLVRMVHGQWVRQVPSMWITEGVRRLKTQNPPPQRLAQLDAYMRLDRDLLVADLQRRQPAIILVDTAPVDMLASARADGELARELGAYREVARIERVVVLRRDP